MVPLLRTWALEGVQWELDGVQWELDGVQRNRLMASKTRNVGALVALFSRSVAWTIV